MKCDCIFVSTRATTDCYGNPNGNATDDLCGVCEGNNSTCATDSPTDSPTETPTDSPTETPTAQPFCSADTYEFCSAQSNRCAKKSPRGSWIYDLCPSMCCAENPNCRCSRRRARQLAGEEAAYDVAYEIELLTAAAPALVANLENVTAFGATLVAELKKVDVFTADPAITAVASPDVVYVEETEPPTDPSILSSCDARASLSALLSLLSCALLLLYPHW